MLNHIDLTSTLFLDVETVPCEESFEALNPDFQALWARKARQVLRLSEEEELSPEATAQAFAERAGIYAEFGRIICISVGIVHLDKETETLRLRLKSFADPEEKVVLEDFCALLRQHYRNPMKYNLCGHNIKEFDIPYICRRMVVHQIPFPEMLQIAGKKPWETKHLLDTMEMWKFGDRKSFTSLKMLAALLGFPSPKDDIDGSDVARVFYEENDLERIAHYCEKDVLATVQLLLRYLQAPILKEEQVAHVS